MDMAKMTEKKFQEKNNEVKLNEAKEVYKAMKNVVFSLEDFLGMLHEGTMHIVDNYNGRYTDKFIDQMNYRSKDGTIYMKSDLARKVLVANGETGIEHDVFKSPERIEQDIEDALSE